jgi:carbamoyl-phosphate synthase large subunit
LNIAAELEAAGVKILGTRPTPSTWPRTETASARSCASWASPARVGHGQQHGGGPGNRRPHRLSPDGAALLCAGRPGHGGRHDEEMLRDYVAAVEMSPGTAHSHRQVPGQRHRGRGRRHLPTARTPFVPAVMEHIELAGIHSGDSACVIPPVSIAGEAHRNHREYTKKIARSPSNCRGPDEHPVRHLPMTRCMCWKPTPGPAAPCPWCPRSATSPWPAWPPRSCWARSLADLGLSRKAVPHFGVKEAVFPFNMFPEVDPVLGPEMRSTGEVLGMAWW